MKGVLKLNHPFLHFIYSQRIERVNLNGTAREIIMDRASGPFAMTLFGNYIYYTDWNLKAVIRAEKHTGGNQVTMWQNANGPRPMDIHVYHKDRQPCKYLL